MMRGSVDVTGKALYFLKIWKDKESRIHASIFKRKERVVMF